MASAAAVRAALAAALAGAEAEARDYACDVAAGVLEDASARAPAEELAAELHDALGPLLEDAGLESDASAALCARLAATHLGGSAGSPAEVAGEPWLLELRNIILAFAGRVLMKPGDLCLRCGRRYALVGQNGVGKTTLLVRLAAGDIAGFPPALRVASVAHEALAGSDATCADFLRQPAGRGCDGPVADGAAQAALTAVGFTPGLAASRVGQLSGGWRMRLALARAMLHKVDLLLLDEPTNHLDAAAHAWLQAQLTAGAAWRGVTVVTVSHDADFLAATATDVIHFADQRLEFYAGGMPAFRAARPDVTLPGKALAAAAAATNSAASDPAAIQRPESHLNGAGEDPGEWLAAAAAAVAAGSIKPFLFPDPGLLDGVKSKNKVVLRAKDLTYTHPGASAPVLRGCTARLCLASRVGLVGANGAGKTTLLRLLVGEAVLPPGCGELFRHQNLRIAYVAQHALHHLEEAAGLTPVAYLQQRFARGRDAEDAKKSTLALTAEERALSEGRHGIAAIVGRRAMGKELFYEVRKSGRLEKDNTWEPLSFLAKEPPYVMKLVRDYDERLKALQGGMEVRPIHAAEVRAHLAAFGIGDELCGSKIKGFSGGQKSRLVVAGALWNKPHLIALDEPTNYLDRESLAALASALKAFNGAVLVVSHSQGFVEALCSERWLVQDGTVTVLKERRGVED